MTLKFVFQKLQEDLPSDKVAARFVGGCVRKHLTNQEIDDIDIATVISSEEIKKKFNNTNFKIIDTGIKHGTITAVIDNYKFEITTLREDVSTDGRHATVKFSKDWRNDASRRDFTINSLYYDLDSEVIYDYVDGMHDIENKQLRLIKKPSLSFHFLYILIRDYIHS